MADKVKQKALYDERRAKGLCVDCGAKVDEYWKYVRCKACRDYHTEASRNWRKKHPKPVLTLKEQAALEAANREKNAAARKMIEDAKINRKANKCLKCEWASITGSKVMCIFPEGSCMKE